jgi:predicted AlkP superfamily phosphohydrolase/phosphomutase/tetratricopeptide (TPR) repeat protein
MTPTDSPPGKKLLLIGWDSADWKIIRPLIEGGELPVLAQLLKNGVSGNLTTLEPVLSPMLWTSIATGKHAYHHGVHGFTEVDPVTGKVVPVSAATRQCRTLWEMLAEHGLKSNVVGWFATHGEQNPCVNVVSNLFPYAPKKEIKDPADWPPPAPGTYWPPELAEHLNEQRLHPCELDGDLLHLFVKEAAKIDQDKDPRLFKLAERLAEAISINAATTWLMQNRPWNLTAVYFRAIDEICHDFMPFHPPKMAGVAEDDFAKYADVVNSAYRLHDMFLARLIGLAGKDAAVVLVSDHGFHSDHLRPVQTPNVPAGIVVWHRPQGIFAAAGPGFAVNEQIDGARLFDVTPTILRWFGLPHGQDMEGRVLHSAFSAEPPAAVIPTWEPPTDTASPATRPRLTDVDNRALLEQFVALGYMEKTSSDPSEAAANTLRENNWQLAQALMSTGRMEQALPLLEDVYAAFPERSDYAQRLAFCQLSLGLVQHATETIEAAIDSFKSPVQINLLRANIAFHRGQAKEALDFLQKVHEAAPNTLPLWEQIGRVYLKLRRWNDAENACRKVLEVDPEHVLAWIGLARCQIHRGQSEAAVESAVEAVSLDYSNALAHLNLGLALGQLERWEESAQALSNAILMSPGLIPPYRLLARVLKKMGRDKEADETMERASGMRFVYDFQKNERRGRIRDAVTVRDQQRRESRQRQRERQARLKEEAAAAPVLDLIIVSGLPRSGTSLMMQMLAAAGMEPLTDGERIADESNPEGYLEWEPIKQLPRTPRILEKAAGKVVKIVSPLLGYLPPKHRYKIIFMRRPVAEVVRSQQRMLERTGKPVQATQADLQRAQSGHLQRILSALRLAKQVELLEVDFPSLVADPVSGAREVVAFLGASLPSSPDITAMAASVNPKLHREQQSNAV